MSQCSAWLAPCRCAPGFCGCHSRSLAPGGDTGEDGAATGVQPFPQLLPQKLLPFPSLSAGLRELQLGEGGKKGGREEGKERTTLKGLVGREVQPQAAYVHQPGVRVFHGLIQHAAGPLLVRSAGVCHGLDGREDDICLLPRFEVFSKRLWEGRRKEGREDISHQMPWWRCLAEPREQLWQERPGSAVSSACRKAGSRGCSHCTGEDENRGPSG